MVATCVAGLIDGLYVLGSRARVYDAQLLHLSSSLYRIREVDEAAQQNPRSPFDADAAGRRMHASLQSMRECQLRPSDADLVIGLANGYLQGVSNRSRGSAQGRLRDGPRQSARFLALEAVIARQEVFARQAEQTSWTAASAGTFAILILVAISIALLVERQKALLKEGALIAVEHEIVCRSELRFSALVSNSADITTVLTPRGEITYVSSAVDRVLGYCAASLVSRVFYELIHPDDRDGIVSTVERVSRFSSQKAVIEARLRNSKSDWQSFEIVVANMLAIPEVEGILLTCRDISERKVFETQLEHRAFHDPLTGLPNRALLMQRLTLALERSKSETCAFSVLFIDLDNFKLVNDGLGHRAGDLLLMEVAQRLTECVRAGDTVSRLGGDEFAILLEGASSRQYAVHAADRVIQTLREPVHILDSDVFPNASAGVVVNGAHYSLAEDVLRDADTAMYEAKSEGKSRYVVFEDAMNIQAKRRLEIETDLHRALDEEQFEVYYQPIVSLEDGSIAEVEALVRWRHPTRGFLPPSEFIPVAEDTGLIVDLGEWVLRTACRQASQWRASDPSLSTLRVGVNVSVRQLRLPEFVSQVKSALSESGLPGGQLKLELTETIVIEDTDVIIPRLHQLKAMGVQLAIDDFGSGYSSMTYISTLPIDTLKIDKEFTAKLGSREQDAIVEAIVCLAKALNVDVTSEGIETVEQMDVLREIGCDKGQGYYFAKPMPADRLELVLTRPLPAGEPSDAFPSASRPRMAA